MQFKNFGIRLGESIAECGLTQAEVARKLKTSPSLVSRWRNEEILPGMGNCKKLSKILNVTIEWLLTGANTGGTSPPKDEKIIIFTEEEELLKHELIVAQRKIISLMEENASLKDELLKKSIPLSKKNKA